MHNYYQSSDRLGKEHLFSHEFVARISTKASGVQQ